MEIEVDLTTRTRNALIATHNALSVLTATLQSICDDDNDAYDPLILQTLSEIAVGYLEGVNGGALHASELAGRARRSAAEAMALT